MSKKNIQPRQATPSAAKLDYLPRDPSKYRPAIGMIGCGDISKQHLRAYAAAGYRVAALCDIDRKSAVARRDEFFPDAQVFTDHREMLKLADLEVIDATTHPEVRGPLVESALLAGKHVLSQKPFVLDLAEGKRLADLADRQGVLLAVNQNGRWAPHFSYLREAVRAGLIGEVVGVHCGVHWDHSWVKGTPFEKVHHLILYDFAIHWFDFLTTIMGDFSATRVYASATMSKLQTIAPPMVAQASIEYPHTQATLVFDANVPTGGWDRVLITGSEGVLRSAGKNLESQQVELQTDDGTYSPNLKGNWFPDGFHGTMGELLCAIEEGRQPMHSARNNLRSLELCFAAVASSVRGEPVIPGTVATVLEPSTS